MKNLTGCATRESLLQIYQRLLRHYTEELLTTGKQIGFDAAEKQLADLREKCIAARKELHHHEAEHRCMADAAKA